MADYTDQLEYDDEGVLVGKSVEKAISRVAKSEPNLFRKKNTDGTNTEEEIDDQEIDDDNQDDVTLRGKGPSGGAGDVTSGTKSQKLVKEGLAMLNIKPAGTNDQK
jgi:hypothetical protein